MSIKDPRATYAGEQLQAAGILAFADGCVLTVYRSGEVADGHCWCGVGGKIEIGETPEQAARREFQEEAGILPPDVLYQALVYETPTLRFTNYVGLLPAKVFPRLNWESDGYAWTKLENIPRPFHYGLTALLESAEFKSALVKINGETAAIPQSLLLKTKYANDIRLATNVLDLAKIRRNILEEYQQTALTAQDCTALVYAIERKTVELNKHGVV